MSNAFKVLSRNDLKILARFLKVPTPKNMATSRTRVDELERLFPDGFHRGALKIAGLRVR